MTSENRKGGDSPPPFWTSRYAIGLVVMAAIAGYFLVTEHLAHTVGALPYALLLACPLIHVFMHRGHGAHSHHRDSRDSERSPGNPDRSKKDSL